MRLSLFLLAGGCLLAPMAYASENPGGYTTDLEGHCQVWAPSMLGGRDYPVRYTGACRNGRAEGRGKAEWLYRYADMRVKTAWEGEFRNGVFLDGQAINGHVEPLPGDRYLVDMGTIGAGKLRFVSRSPQTAPLRLCQVEMVVLELNNATDAQEESRSKDAILKAGQRYRELCPQGRDADVALAPAPLTPRPNGTLPPLPAQARYALDSGTLSGYRNEITSKLQQERQKAEYAQGQEKALQQFNDFSQKNAIAAWLTLQQLNENPFRWEGKTVGLVVRLDQMLTRDSALVDSGLKEWAEPLWLKGISPDFPGSDRAVLLAARVGQREVVTPASNKGRTDGQYVVVRHVDSRTCERPTCSEWFFWSRNDRQISWGQPYTPAR